MDSELKILLALYAEDVMRAVEREVRAVEALVRKKYPGAEYIELEPMSVDARAWICNSSFVVHVKACTLTWRFLLLIDFFSQTVWQLMTILKQNCAVSKVRVWIGI